MPLGSTVWQNSTLNGNTTNSLNFNAQYAQDGTYFRCVVTDNGGRTAISTSVLLTVEAEDGLVIDASMFPYMYFRQYVSNEIDVNHNGRLTEQEINAVTTIDCSIGQVSDEYGEISDLTGIEIFNELITLDFSGNTVITVDLRQNTKLENLFCAGNYTLTSILLPYNLTVIQANAFEGCTSLGSIEIPAGVTKIDDYAFYNCTSLESVVSGNDIELIGKGAFKNCSKLKSYTTMG
jgi:hypothetical protein